MGAEPNIIDKGPHEGLQFFIDQEQTALHLMQSFDTAVQKGGQVYKKLNGPEYLRGRWHRADQRHHGVSFQDNHVIPYEGVKVSTFSDSQQDVVRNLAKLSLDYLPEKALAAHLQEITSHWEDTWFCWIGGYGDRDAFYYKVQSPVIMVEFDQHSGVFLNNKEPLPFHSHTLVRTPNGNDYGKQLLRQYQEQKDRV